jgi:hypothetical protein
LQAVPNLHLTKVAVGVASIEALENRLARRAHGPEVRIPTRMRPKRAEELIGGNLYWIVKHRLVACNAILRIEDRKDGKIDFVCSSELVQISPVPKRAHQGWRYFEQDAAHGEQEADSGVAALPPPLYGKLAALALV